MMPLSKIYGRLLERSAYNYGAYLEAHGRITVKSGADPADAPQKPFVAENQTIGEAGCGAEEVLRLLQGRLFHTCPF